MFVAILSGGSGGQSLPGKQGGFGGPRGSPIRGMVGGRVQSMDFWDDTISGVGQGWVDLRYQDDWDDHPGWSFFIRMTRLGPCFYFLVVGFLFHPFSSKFLG